MDYHPNTAQSPDQDAHEMIRSPRQEPAPSDPTKTRATDKENVIFTDWAAI